MKETSFCPQGERFLCGYLEQRLSSAEQGSFEAHLKDCAVCTGQAKLWDDLARLPMAGTNLRPSPQFGRDFEAMLASELRQERKASGPLPVVARQGIWRRAGVAWAAAALLAVAGFLGGLLAANSLRGITLGDGRSKSDLAELRQELRLMRSLMAVSLLQQQSTMERLRGVSYTAGLDDPGQEVIQTLLRTLRADSSMEVRLAAAEALQKYGGLGQVRQSMAEALRLETAPLVQLTLIDSLVTWQEQKATPVLRLLAAEEKLEPAVRQRAVKALREIPAVASVGPETYR